jgi:hypothetical protein
VLARIFGKKMLEAWPRRVSMSHPPGLPRQIVPPQHVQSTVHGLRALAAEAGEACGSTPPVRLGEDGDGCRRPAGGSTRRRHTGRIPTACFATPDDIARAIAFSPTRKKAILNAIASVDGGWPRRQLGIGAAGVRVSADS